MNDFTRYAQQEFVQMRNQLGGAWIAQVVSVLADLVKDSKYSVTVCISKKCTRNNWSNRFRLNSYRRGCKLFI